MSQTIDEPRTLSPLLTVREAADVLRISEWTLTQQSSIRSVRVGRNVRYDQADLSDWIEAQKTD